MDDFFKNIYNHPSITNNDFKEISSFHKKVEFSKNEIVLNQGKTSNEYYLIEKGVFRSFVYNYNGNEITTGFFCPNEILIEVSSLFQRIPTNENLEALTNGTAWKIEFNDFQKLFHTIEGFREWGRSWMSNELFISKQRSVNMLTQNATQRYLCLITEKPQIIKEAPLKHIASFLGITDTSLSRIRKEISLEL
ncbi:Crp/Fnr family transcriptional regulator [Abyssalbus ytuae]|uniref:Crp/Fnr family transcriptional regulator n=1 Tax=Abyssalbus ytuae TaxID=2926907 RepID=A0A9E6ZIE5_9FLAO|nr:Crp/Fnr family transcriptional regulator [Abyssalbus ytuae]UOB16097.1 Crp/Fnr family transcriptional regulator [Abyssalbus ytuae]